jgi:Ecdysteroid kinase-like family
MATESLPSAAEAELLTEALRRSGVLAKASVSHVAVMSSLKKQRSHTFRLGLTYEGRAADAPNSIILKMGYLDGTGRPSYANHREIAFYRDIAPAVRVVPRCFEAAAASDTSAWHLLLEDLTDTHFFATEWPLPPTLEQCQSIVEAWAKFHAAWWDDSRLGVSVGTWPDKEWERYLQQGFTEQFANFANRFGQAMPPERRELYERLLDRAPRLLARYHIRRDLTLNHGDAHWWSCFLPRAPDGEVRLIDWESWSIDIATCELAYMMAMLWFPDMRRRIEQPLLDRYHAVLLANGVTGYDRRALHEDYRLSVLLLILRPIGQAAKNIAPRVWWPNLERIMLAVDDLGCRELLA